MKGSSSPKSESGDEIAKMRQEIDALRQAVESLEKDLSMCKEAIYELHQEPRGVPSLDETRANDFEKTCKFCLDIISPIEIVRQIFVAGSSETATFWAIIDTPPAEDSLRETYDDHLDTLNIMMYNVPFVIHVIDITILPEIQKSEDAIPPEAKIIWER